MSRIEFVSSEVTTISGKSKTTGNDYTLRKQEAYLYSGRKHPERFEIMLGRTQDGKERAPYAPGFYRLAESSIVVNAEYKALELSRFETTFERLPEAEQGEYSVKPVRAAG